MEKCDSRYQIKQQSSAGTQAYQYILYVSVYSSIPHPRLIGVQHNLSNFYLKLRLQGAYISSKGCPYFLALHNLHNCRFFNIVNSIIHDSKNRISHEHEEQLISLESLHNNSRALNFSSKIRNHKGDGVQSGPPFSKFYVFCNSRIPFLSMFIYM